MAKFEKGDIVYHSFYGTGKITSTRSLDLGGAERLYYVVELATGEELMIPIKEVGEAHLHAPLNPEVIIDVLSAAPEELADDHNVRRQHIQGKVNSGNPEQVSEVVRDLAWREYTTQLYSADKKLMSSAKKLLANMLMTESDVNMQEASQRLEAILKQTVLTWKASGHQHDESM